MMRNKLIVLLVLLLGVTVVGCGKRKAVEGVEVEETMVIDEGASATGMDDQSGAAGGLLGAGDGDPLNQRRVYFEYDSSAIDDESRIIVEAHSAYLVTDPSLSVVLEGHADERGTREYNLALGERRAQAVARLMQALGVTADRIQTVSYGEERPVALGQDEESFQLNRRVEILYGN
ncbi:MAG: peptidoglycan-associated lipoprotein Pal [Gammaproteobacteria bacterium]|nr:peptidoglycan-associated lipoprotein Pal [Gammaproteobacteria bacterium]